MTEINLRLMRRHWLLALGAFALLTFLTFVLVRENGGRDLNKAPHIVVMIADDLGVKYAPCHSDDTHMPFLSGQCKNSAVFTRVYAHPYCTPSRAAMLTGRQTFRTGAGDTHHDALKLPLNETTLPELIKRHSKEDYQFAAFGKWHLADDMNGGYDNPNLQGFDYFEGNPRQHHTYKYYDYEWAANGKVVDESVCEYKTTHIVNRLIKHFEEHGRNSPTLYWVGFVSPHVPFHLPPGGLHDHVDEKTPTTENACGVPLQQLPGNVSKSDPRVLTYFRAMLQALDQEIRRLEREIQRLSDDRPVIFVFLSDNGDVGKVLPHGPGDLRGAKATLYEAGVRVPLMVWSSEEEWSSRYAKADSRLIHLSDLFPTLAQLAGVSAETAMNNVDAASFADSISNLQTKKNRSVCTSRARPHEENYLTNMPQLTMPAEN